MPGMLGKKIGITQVFNEMGEAVPCTVIEVGPCYVTQIRTPEKDGYEAIQLGFADAKEKRLPKPIMGHLAKARVKPVRHFREFRGFDSKALAVGAEVKVDTVFAVGDRVKVVGTSKGRGFQGVVKRHHFSGVGMTTHGQSDRVRAPGSIGSSSFPSRVFKGMRMAGRMGRSRVTVRNLRVIRVIPDSNLLVVQGSVPGHINGIVEIRKTSGVVQGQV